MASSSSAPPRKYQVFLSFRGEDTRNNFISHLYTALDQRGIVTYMDEHNLETGQSISLELTKSIKDSEVAIIVFSKTYASSTWCLDELVNIMECKNTYGKIVIPIFYDVDPSDVGKQKNSFAESFAEHEVKFKDNMEKVQIWKENLYKASRLKGVDIRGRNEATCIKEIVEDIFRKFRPKASTKDLIGRESRMTKQDSLLFKEPNGVCVVEIWGMGGIGKTTNASAISKKQIVRFEGDCFLQDKANFRLGDWLETLSFKDKAPNHKPSTAKHQNQFEKNAHKFHIQEDITDTSANEVLKDSTQITKLRSAQEFVHHKTNKDSTKMEVFTPIVKISPSTRSWKVKVQVVDKMRPRDSSSLTPTKYQNITLEDEAGTRVLAFIYNTDIILFCDCFELYKKYVITNAIVRDPKPMTKLPDSEYPYVWIITGSTPVADVKSDNHLSWLADLKMTRFTELYKFIGKSLEVDVLAVVIDKLPLKKIKNKAGGFSEVSKFVLVDQEEKPLILTMWSDFISHDGNRITQELKSMPIILAKRVCITLFHGMSLTTKPNSSFHVNPSLKEAASLKSWALKNNQLLTELAKKRAHQYILRDLVNPYDQEYVDINNLPSDIDKNNCVWTKAKLMIVDEQQSFHYLACDNCGKATRAEYKEEFRCMQCTQNTIAMPRFKFQVDIIDHTGSVTVAVFGENGKKIFSLEADEIASRQQAGKKLLVEEINKKLRNETFIIQLRSFTPEACGQTQPKYNIAWLYDDEVSHKKIVQLESSSKKLPRALGFVGSYDESTLQDEKAEQQDKEESSKDLVSSSQNTEDSKLDKVDAAKKPKRQKLQ